MRSIRIALVVASLAALAVTGSASAGPSPAGAAQEADIVQTAVGAGNLKTLTKLLKRAHLVHVLKQPGPYTVFAPTDAAFREGAGAEAERAASKQVEAAVRASIPRGRRRAACVPMSSSDPPLKR